MSLPTADIAYMDWSLICGEHPNCFWNYFGDYVTADKENLLKTILYPLGGVLLEVFSYSTILLHELVVEGWLSDELGTASSVHSFYYYVYMEIALRS